MPSTDFQNLLQDKLQLLYEESSFKIAIHVEKESNLSIASIGLNSILNWCNEAEKIKFIVGLFELTLQLYDNPDLNNSKSLLNDLIGCHKALSFECKPFISYHETTAVLWNHFRIYFKFPTNDGMAKYDTIFHIEGNNEILAKLFAEFGSKYQVIRPIWNQELSFWEFPENLEELIK